VARKKVFGFNKKQDFIRTRNAVRKLEGMQKTGARYRNEFPTGGGTGGSEVRVKIKSIDDSTTPISATARIVGYDYGVGSASKENDDREIIVHDHVGCNLVEPYSDLYCRTGYARYMRNYATDELQWELKSLECLPPCNVQCYPYFQYEPYERAFADALLASDIDILFLTAGTNGCDGDNAICTWNTPRYTDAIIEFIKSGRSVVVFAEVENAPSCMSQQEINAMNAFYAAIGGDAYLTLDDLVVGCQVGAIVADDTHPFFNDTEGTQNVFFFGIGGASKVNENGSTTIAYVYDPGTGTTDTSNCVMAGNRYPAEGAGWVFLAGDANMMDVPLCKNLGDIDEFYGNICRLQCLDELPDS
jgi:hypothetical protein